MAVFYLLPTAFLIGIILVRLKGETGEKALPYKKALLWAAVVLPYLIACLFLFMSGGKPVLHFKLEGYKFSLQDRHNPLTIGGSMENDIFIKENEWPKDAFFISKKRDGFYIDKGKGYSGHEIVEISGKIAGLTAVKNGSKITISKRSQGKRGVIISSNFEISQGGIAGLNVNVIDGTYVYPIPLRKTEIPFIDLKVPLLTFPGAYNQVFPFGKLISPEDWQQGKGFTSCLLFGDFEVENKKGEIFEPFFLALDSNVSVDGVEIKPFPLKIEDGSSLSFLRLYGTTRPRLKPVLRIKEVILAEDTIQLVPDRPETIAIRMDKSDQYKCVMGRIENLSKEMIIDFRSLSDTFSKYFAFLSLDNQTISVSGPFASKKYAYNQPIEIGSEESFIFKILKHETPIRLIALLLFTGIVVIFFSHFLLEKLRYLVLFGSVAILTASRVLYAYSASVLPPFSNEAVPFSLFLLVFAPSLVVAVDSLVKAMECKEPEFLEEKNHYIMNGFAALLFALVVGVPQVSKLSGWLMLGSAAAVGIPLVLLLWMRLFSSPTFQKHEKKFEKYKKKFTDLLFKSSTRPLKIVIIVFFIIRLFLFLTGNKESINIGASRFSISIITVPILLWFIAWCTSRFIADVLNPAKKEKKIIYRYVFYTFTFGAIFSFFAIISSDLGQLIFALPISMFLTGIMAWAHGKIPPKVRKPLYILPIPLALIVLFLLFPIPTLKIIEGVIERDIVVKDIFATDIVSKGENVLRLMQYVAPTHLQEIGSKSSESVAQHYAIMNAYTRRGFLGEGYMNVKVHPSLYKTCLNDNISGVYIFSQFGVLGALAIIFAYAILILTGYRSREEILSEKIQLGGLLSLLSILSALTVIVVSIYMIGANCNLLPFTGRNLYFMGLNSMSDIFESALLLSFITAGIAAGSSRFHSKV